MTGKNVGDLSGGAFFWSWCVTSTVKVSLGRRPHHSMRKAPNEETAQGSNTPTPRKGPAQDLAQYSTGASTPSEPIQYSIGANTIQSIRYSFEVNSILLRSQYHTPSKSIRYSVEAYTILYPSQYNTSSKPTIQ